MSWGDCLGNILTTTGHVTTASAKQLTVAALLVKTDSAGFVPRKNRTQGNFMYLKAPIHENLKHLTEVGHEFPLKEH